MTKVKWADLKKAIQNKEAWANEMYKEKKGKRVKLTDLGFSKWQVLYNDGSTVTDDFNSGTSLYKDIKRQGVKSISILDNNGKILHTVQVVNDKFLICLRNSVRARDGVSFGDPKRLVILATEGEYDFVWDDGDIDELTQWGDEEPYTKPTGGVFDIW